jgi:hypothetical protein
MDKIIYIEDIPVIELGEETYSPSDVTLISTLEEQSTFNSQTDYIEYFIYDGNKNLFISENKLDTFNIYDNNLLINPEGDLEERIQDQGKYYTVYNFLKPLLSSSIQETYYIAEISTDRTEVRLSTTDILSQDVIDGVGALKQEIDTATYYRDFYLNFGSNQLIIANNVLLDTSIPDQPTVLIKLYEPLPDNITANRQCWAVDKIAESRAYLLNVSISFEDESESIEIQGPNFSILTTGQTNSSNQPVDSTILLQTPSSSLLYELNNKLNNPGVTLNIDHSEYSNFIFFSTARTRVENFYYKLSLLEEYNYSSSISVDTTSFYNSGSYGYWENKINETITGFDGFERYLYFESSSTTWPKSNSTPPYINVPSTSSQGQNWLTSTLTSADSYDDVNKDRLTLTIPEFIKNDTTNVNYELFVDMVAQVYDEIWLYLTDVTQKYNTTNGVDQGLSKDIVSVALKDLGLKLYENNFTSNDLYSTYLGITPSGSLLPGTGEELIDTYVTASATGSLIPINNLSSETYKRLYHNLPVLLKKKGTAAGLRVLVNAFGIPDTILRINEFGGKDKNLNTWDYYQNEYNYSLEATGSYYISSSFTLNTNWNASDNTPGAIEFRFKPETLPPTNASQSLWYTDQGIGVFLEYTGSGLATGSYSGSTVDPYSQYATLKFIAGASSASVYLPFFNGTWWSVLVNSGSNGYELFAKNNTYRGLNGNTLGFQASASINIPTLWSASTEISFVNTSASYEGLSGSIQEIRYYTKPILESTFDAYVMNPSSIEESDYLAFRASLGGELYTGSTSIHPRITGSWSTTSSFASTSTFYISSNIPTYQPNVEINLYDQPAVGIKNAITSKIHPQSELLYGEVLSTLQTLQQQTAVSESYTQDVNYLEVGYSPQNEINEDIMNTFGYFNLGEYIGDPRQISSSNYNYPELDALKNYYFEKYKESYNYQDYFRLIKFYDNSLFKIIKDFIPARTAAATGAIVKQHLLERNRQRPAQLSWTRPEYSASVFSVARDYESGSIGVFEGGPAGAVNNWVNISQSYTASIPSPKGPVVYIESSEYEFFNGEYSGSRVDVINGNLQDNPLLAQEYKVSIPDLQNLNATLSSVYNGITASLGNPSTGRIPFDVETPPIGYYSNTAYEYTPGFDVVVDLEVFITGTFINTTAIEDSSLTVFLREDGNTIATSFDDNGNDDILINSISKNFELKAGSTYTVEYLYAENDNPSDSTARLSPESFWKITVQNLSTTSTYYLDPTVYAQQNFPGNLERFNDYNAIYNNVYSNRVSNKYFDVDYTNGALNPSNFGPIISQSALYAQVQDSNYDPKSAFFELRYSGTKYTSQNYNVFTEGDAQKDPAIDYYTDWFAYYDWIGGSNPQYPGGANFHLTRLINANTGEILTLDTANINLGLVESIFRQGDTPTQIVTAFSSIETSTELIIETGGGLYNTIYYNTGSTGGVSLGIDWENDDPLAYVSRQTRFTGSGTYTVLEEENQGWLYPLLTGSDPNLGNIKSIRASNSGYLFNKRTGEYYNTSINSGVVLWEDTYLPLQYGDFIRFGSNVGDVTGSLDYNFDGLSLNRIVNFTAVSASGGNTLQISPEVNTPARTLLDSANDNNQNFRIFRRVPNETFVVTKQFPANIGAGILLPQNFNPDLDPLTVTREAGLI